MITKNCTKCKLSLTLDMFFNDKHSKDGKCYQCKTCQKNKRTVEYLGCTIPFLKEYLEKQFLLGMTWDNYGLNGWNIDHRMPIALAKDKNDLLNFLHYSNLQPLWEKQNKVKSDRIICPLMALSLN